jgi:hypothetical protein
LQRDCTESAGPKGGLSDDIDKRPTARATPTGPAAGVCRVVILYF